MSTNSVNPRQYGTVIDRMLDTCPNTADLFEKEVKETSPNFIQETNRFLRMHLCNCKEDTRQERLSLDDDAGFDKWWNGVNTVLEKGLLS